MSARIQTNRVATAMVAGALTAPLLLTRPLHAQQAPPAPTVAAPLPAAPPPAAPVKAAPPAPVAAPAPPPPATPVAAGLVVTDHDVVVRRWGVEVRRIGTFQKTPSQDPVCKDNCPVALSSLGVRRWTSHTYAFHLGLAVATGSGSTRTSEGRVAQWDTYLGFGPTLGSSFLLTNWKHVAVSVGPQIDVVYFMPAASRSKTLLLGARGVAEAELHLGFWGMPEISLGFSGGLQAHLRITTKPQQLPTESQTKSEWSIETTGPHSPWGLVTNAFLRFYF